MLLLGPKAIMIRKCTTSLMRYSRRLRDASTGCLTPSLCFSIFSDIYLIVSRDILLGGKSSDTRNMPLDTVICLLVNVSYAGVGTAKEFLKVTRNEIGVRNKNDNVGKSA